MTSPDPFLGVPAPLRAALERRGFSQLTPVQARVVSALLEGEGRGRNLLISSQTGSGKTVALGLALAASVLREAQGGPVALVITPTRELAAQVRAELAWLFADAASVSVDVVTGGTDVSREKQRLRRHVAVLVGTPGRLLDHMRSGALDTTHVSEVVLDEADQMLDMGFKDELDAILTHLPGERRSHLVSATFPPAVRELAQRFQGEALHLQGTALGQANSDIQHVAYPIRPRDRHAALVNLLLEGWGERCLIFVRTRLETTELSEALARDGFAALPFSGELPQAQRTRTLDAFRSGTINILVATDVAARGIDVPDIATVIHADIPKEADVYTHRSGRTGRAGKPGKSLSIVPATARARVQRLLAQARITARWEAVPSPKKIRQAITKDTRRSLYERLGGAELSESELTYAQNLLEKQPAAHVVAMLLRMAERPLPCEPHDVPAPEPRSSGAASATRGFRAESARPASANGYTRFLLTWGERQGATPSRCMSHVCRRGGITRHLVGAIDVGPNATVVEVSLEVADEFERRCQKPDPRDPQVRILRQGAGPNDSARGRHARRAPRAADARPHVKRPGGTPRSPARTRSTPRDHSLVAS